MAIPKPHPAIAAYRLRVNRRARRILLRVTALGEVEVVVPPVVSQAEVDRVLQLRRDWLQNALERFERGQAGQPAARGLRPDEIRLAALDEIWRIDYVPAAKRKLHAQPADRRLTVLHGLGAAARGRVLQDWLQKRARAVLPDWLAQVAADTGLGFNRVTVRGQKTRWGSCSAARNINLNRNLLFVPPATVRYLMIHELCHTRQLNHSPAYWAEVARHCPDYRRHEKVLRAVAQELPLWVHVARAAS
jgi:predicted metal-dependent hydrolase